MVALAKMRWFPTNVPAYQGLREKTVKSVNGSQLAKMKKSIPDMSLP